MFSTWPVAEPAFAQVPRGQSMQAVIPTLNEKVPAPQSEQTVIDTADRVVEYFPVWQFAQCQALAPGLLASIAYLPGWHDVHPVEPAYE